jgi:probable addiction module antidote protein
MTELKKQKDVEDLKNTQIATNRLRDALEKFVNEDDAESFLLMLRKLARAKGGMSRLSKKVGINRQNLYRTFASTGNPKFRSLNTILKGLGYRLSIEPIELNNSNDDDNR